ncbi:MAG: signal transduction histidine kinase [Myxococcota bacterium]
MRLPRGSVSSLLSLAAGMIAAGSVATTWLPMIQYAEEREVQSLSRRLVLMASLSGEKLIGGHSPSPVVDLGSSNRVQARLSELPTISGLDQALVLAESGEVLASSTGEFGAELTLAQVFSACPMAEVLGGEAVLIPPQIGLSGATVQGACTPVLGSSSLAIGMFVAIKRADYEEILAAQKRRASNQLLLLGALSGLLVMFAIRMLLSPIQKISTAAAQIAEGEHSVRVRVAGPEELRQLARAVNSLASYLERREDEIGSRMAVVRQLASVVAHEVRNPLQSLSLLCTLARTEEDTKKREALLISVEEEIQVLEGVVQRFLRNSGPLRISRTEVNLVKIINQVDNISRPRADKAGVSLLIQAPGSCTMQLDGSLVRRAAENLVLNAIEFAGMNPPGQVTVSLMPRDKHTLLIVDDDGPGVPPHERERIFEQYYSSKPGGTGLGLSLVKRVFDTHGGYIRCEESPLGGARFIAALPVWKEEGQ